MTIMSLSDFDIASIPRSRIASPIIQLAARLAEPEESAFAPEAAGDNLLTVEQAAAKLGVTPEWLYRRGKRLGLAVKLGDGTLRFSQAALDTYIKNQTVSTVPTRRRRVS
jgi:predicted DNA-binding transcriptional regulator AlpA